VVDRSADGMSVVSLSWPSLDDVITECQTETVSEALVAQRLTIQRDDHVTLAGLTLITLTHKKVCY